MNCTKVDVTSGYLTSGYHFWVFFQKWVSLLGIFTSGYFTSGYSQKWVSLLGTKVGVTSGYPYNAGILRDETLGVLNVQSINDQFQTNSLAPLLVTESLLDSLMDQQTLSKVVFITSRMGSITDNTSGGRYGYRMSKVALNIGAKSMSVDLKDNNVAVAIIHPGLVGTDMIGGVGNLTPDEAAQSINERIDGLSLDNTGTFWHSNGEVLPW
ncbi:SDR family NAD(P)-dependent oxidoreductase [Marinicellulosiphila megalodicopiae]|uniref:SDR family NAD(P)-dependent oxidoreductase n=1 Tax=Marinicellulosiphila megalodicopiae TaxID=2724896 RepID=UPI003BB18322